MEIEVEFGEIKDNLCIMLVELSGVKKNVREKEYLFDAFEKIYDDLFTVTSVMVKDLFVVKDEVMVLFEKINCKESVMYLNVDVICELSMFMCDRLEAFERNLAGI